MRYEEIVFTIVLPIKIGCTNLINSLYVAKQIDPVMIHYFKVCLVSWDQSPIDLKATELGEKNNRKLLDGFYYPSETSYFQSK